jgi:hypothetical protein
MKRVLKARKMQFQVHAVPTLNCQQQWGAHELFGIAFHVLFVIKK